MTLVKMNAAAVQARRERREKYRLVIEKVMEVSDYAKSLDNVYTINKRKPQDPAAPKSKN